MTTDAGANWSTIAQDLVIDDVNGVIAGSLFSDTGGFVLIDQPESQAGCSPNACGPELLATTDAGSTWTKVNSWPPG